MAVMGSKGQTKVTLEVMAIIAFIVEGLLLVIWILGGARDFGLFFGWRLSDVVAGDTAGLIVSSGGVAANVTKVYEIQGQASGNNPVYYRLCFSNNLICVQSIWSTSINTTDCYPIPPLNLNNNNIPPCTTEITSGKITINKQPAMTNVNSAYISLGLFTGNFQTISVIPTFIQT
jgi:hypothetical protein